MAEPAPMVLYCCSILDFITGDLAGRFKTGLLQGVNAPPRGLAAGVKADPMSPATGEGKGESRTLALATNLGLGWQAPAAERERRGEDKARSGESVDSRLVKGGSMSDSIIHCKGMCACVCMQSKLLQIVTIHSEHQYIHVHKTVYTTLSQLRMYLKLAYLVLGNSCNHPLANLLCKYLHPDQSKINKLLPPVLGPTTTDNNKLPRLKQ